MSQKSRHRIMPSIHALQADERGVSNVRLDGEEEENEAISEPLVDSSRVHARGMRDL